MIEWCMLINEWMDGWMGGSEIFRNDILIFFKLIYYVIMIFVN